MPLYSELIEILEELLTLDLLTTEEYSSRSWQLLARKRAFADWGNINTEEPLETEEEQAFRRKLFENQTNLQVDLPRGSSYQCFLHKNSKGGGYAPEMTVFHNPMVAWDVRTKKRVPKSSDSIVYGFHQHHLTKCDPGLVRSLEKMGEFNTSSESASGSCDSLTSKNQLSMSSESFGSLKSPEASPQLQKKHGSPALSPKSESRLGEEMVKAFKKLTLRRQKKKPENEDVTPFDVVHVGNPFVLDQTNKDDLSPQTIKKMRANFDSKGN